MTQVEKHHRESFAHFSPGLLQAGKGATHSHSCVYTPNTGLHAPLGLQRETEAQTDEALDLCSDK